MYTTIRQHILNAYAQLTPSSGDPYCEMMHEIRAAFHAEQITRGEYQALFYLLGQKAGIV